MTRGDDAVLSIEGAAHVRGGFTLVVDRFSVSAGEALAIVGPSGSGKSTFLDLAAMTLRPGKLGRFRLAGQDVGALWKAGKRAALTDLRARHLGVVLQTGGMLPYLSLKENALLGRRLLGLDCPGPIPDLFDHLGIAGLAARKPGQVSIGQRQRAALVRAVAHDPEVILADEPTASLDPANAEEAMKTLAELVKVCGTALVMVTHDRGLAERYGLRPIEVTLEGAQSRIGG